MKNKSIGYWRGKPVEEYCKDELVEIIQQMASSEKQTVQIEDEEKEELMSMKNNYFIKRRTNELNNNPLWRRIFKKYK